MPKLWTGQDSARTVRFDQQHRKYPFRTGTEVAQSGSNLIIQAELPGLNENDVKLEATEEGLVIEGERLWTKAECITPSGTTGASTG